MGRRTRRDRQRHRRRRGARCQPHRAHAILHDDLGVYRDVDGQPIYDFTGIDRIYDRVVEIGLRPIAEVSFMPRDLARDPDATVFHSRGIISLSKDWVRWEELVTDVTAHLVDRYGRDEVRQWGFEIWNEANLDVFWSGTRDEYLHLYDVSARAVKSVDAGLLVGGPASAAVGWIDDLLEHVRQAGIPLDLVSTHSYGNAPLDLRPIAARYGRSGLPLWWTEWGAHATHFTAPTIRCGAPPTPAASGCSGSATSANLAGGRCGCSNSWTQRGSQQTATAPATWSTPSPPATPDGGLALVVWNGTVDVTKSAGDPLLDRHIHVTVTDLPATGYHLRHRRLDERHSNLTQTWARISGGLAWPDGAGWNTLR